MKLSTKGRYGVRLMTELALHYREKPVFLKTIAGRQGISEKYLWNLIQPLKAAGLVGSARGPRGGYFLIKPPREVTLYDIVRVLEGPLCLVDCEENPAVCARSKDCISREVWKEASRRIVQTLEQFTLAEITEKEREKRLSGGEDFSQDSETKQTGKDP